jgi:hypothetical protein
MEDAMKPLLVMFLIVGTGLLFFGCSNESITTPELSQSDQTLAPLAKKTYAYFSGTSVNIGALNPPKINNLPTGVVQWRGLVVQTDDEMTDPMVDGIVTWVVHLDIYPDGSDKRWGTGELIIPDVGSWDMTYKGWFIPGEGLTYEVDGHGKGDLKGLKAHWTYFLESPPGVFDVQGYIIEND